MKYKRILIKLSGEALSGKFEFGIDPKELDRLALEITALKNLGLQISLVIGGGNLFRGEQMKELGMDRVAGDHMGMLATMINGLALRDALERNNVPTRLMSAISMVGIFEDYDRRKAIRYLQEGDTVIFTAGTGNPFFTTDTSACLRAIEIQVDIMFKATKVDGVFDSDPLKNPQAIKYSKLSYRQAIEDNLQVMDMTAISLAKDNNLPIRVVSLIEEKGLQKAIEDTDKGTLIFGG